MEAGIKLLKLTFILDIILYAFWLIYGAYLVFSGSSIDAIDYAVLLWCFMLVQSAKIGMDKGKLDELKEETNDNASNP